MSLDKVVREVLSRRDPQGMFVIVADARARDLIEEFRGWGVIAEEVGDEIIFRTRSRSVAERLARALARRGLLRSG